MTTIASVTTAEQLLQTPDSGRRELLRGKLTMRPPAGYDHGRIASRIFLRLGIHVEQHGLGEVHGGDTGFQIRQNPDTVRAPNVAFIASARIPATRVSGFFQGPPDLAVEVISPNDRTSQVAAKIQDWLDAGCRTVWVVDPELHTVTVYRSRSNIVVLRATEQLSGDDIVPGFTIAVAELFAG
jgi:Uma2 family endonuclease